MAKASKNSNQVDHIVVIRSQGALLDLETMVHNAFVESCSWLVKLLETGKAKLPATIRISESNRLMSSVIRRQVLAQGPNRRVVGHPLRKKPPSGKKTGLRFQSIMVEHKVKGNSAVK